jgi:uncharacterized protein YfbU (UPF0304 family)
VQALNERFEMRMDQDTLQAVERWRSQQDDVPSRAEAIRRLIDRGLAPRTDGALVLSKPEMLIVHLLCELHRGQKVKGELDPDFIQAALYGGHLWGLEWKYTGTFHRSFDSVEALRETVDILDMWEFLESGYEKLDKKGKDQLGKDADPFGKNVRFAGFDGNNETEHMGIARFMVKEMERFSRFEGRDLNSHHPSLESHRRMLAVWLPIRQGLIGREMSITEMAKILNARTHPSYVKK